jgi:hypothetical protein
VLSVAVFAVALFLLSGAVAIGPSQGVHADAGPPECDNDPPDVFGGALGNGGGTFNPPGDLIVTGVCIKSADHSGVISSDGTFGFPGKDQDCYTISGINGLSVTVTRTGEESPDCQAISHVDVLTEPMEDTGLLTITKVCIPSDDDGEFLLLLDGVSQGQRGCGESVFDIELAPGTYTVGESAGPGTDLTDYTTSIGGACASDGDVVIVAGDDLTCTITNDLIEAPPVIIVVQPTPEVTAVPPAAVVEATAEPTVAPTALPPAAPVEVAPTTVPTTQPAAVSALPSTGSSGPGDAATIPLWLLPVLLAGLGGLALLSSRVIRP